MVGCTRRPRKRAKLQFADPPWNERSDEWQLRDQQVPADHPAREVVEAMRQLDLTPLFALYLGAGVPPIRPDLMLAMVLIEIRRGRPRPSQWFRDAKENSCSNGPASGFSRRARVGTTSPIASPPLLEAWNAAVLQLRSATGRDPSRAHVVGRHLGGRQRLAPSSGE